MPSHYILFYDPAEERVFQQEVLPLFDGITITKLPYNDLSSLAQIKAIEQPAHELVETDKVESADINRYPVVVTYLNDQQLAQLISTITGLAYLLAPLPHPKLHYGKLGLGVEASLKQAVSSLLKANQIRTIDLLQCNEQLILHSVVIGNLVQVLRDKGVGDGKLSLWGQCKQLLKSLRGLHQILLQPLTLKTHKENLIQTATLGILVVKHARSSALARRIIPEEQSSAAGMLHALVFSPRSWFEFVIFCFDTWLFRGFNRMPKKSHFPGFMGHIKTESLLISHNKPISMLLDGQTKQVSETRLEVLPQALNLLVKENDMVDTSIVSEKESVKVQYLPKGEAIRELVTNPLPWIHHASTEEFKGLFLTLRQYAKLSESYVVLLILSTVLAGIGLFANSASVIIGAMVLAPLMSPIISLAMGVLRQHAELLMDSVKTLSYGVLIALGCATVLAWITPLSSLNSEISARLSPTLLDLGVAILSGVAGAYVHTRSGLSHGIAGIAISVALVPPLAVSGIGIGWGDWAVFSGAFLLFLTNLIGILLAATTTFLLLGYSPFKRAKQGLFVALLLVCIISVPLGFSFRHMVQEHQLITQLNGWRHDQIEVRNVKVQSQNPWRLSVQLVTPAAMTNTQLGQVKQAMEQFLGKAIVLEVTTVIVQP